MLGNLDLSNKESIDKYIEKIIAHYKDHPSIKIINDKIEITSPPFKIPLPELKDIETILKDINTKKAAGPDGILPSMVKHVPSETLKKKSFLNRYSLVKQN